MMFLAVLCIVLLPPFTAGTVVDLTHTYGSDVIYPPVGPQNMFNFTVLWRGRSDITNTWFEINWFSMFEHGGTHMDAPSHFAEGRPRMHEIPAENLIGPGVRIDMEHLLPGNPDYQLTVQDIQAWEAKNGRIPQDAIVMMNTGRYKLFPNVKLFYGTETPDDLSSFHHPGIHPEAAKWLIRERQIKVLGSDCSSIDIGFTKDVPPGETKYPSHVILLSNDVLILEFVSNLDRMPATGSTIFIGAVKLRDGSGGPARILALYGGDPAIGKAAASCMSLLFMLLCLVAVYMHN